MDLTEIALLIIQIQVITASGALSPGPLTAATLGSGVKYGFKGGLLIAFGHMIIEFPMVILLGLGTISIFNNIYIHAILMIIGSSALFYFGYMQMKSSDISSRGYIGYNPILIGSALSLFNIHFIVWWLTIGSILIFKWIELLGFATIPLFYILHVWMDYLWLGILSHLAKLGVDKYGGSYIRIFNIIVGIILILFGIYFLVDALKTIQYIL